MSPFVEVNSGNLLFNPGVHLPQVFHDFVNPKAVPLFQEFSPLDLRIFIERQIVSNDRWADRVRPNCGFDDLRQCNQALRFRT